MFINVLDTAEIQKCSEDVRSIKVIYLYICINVCIVCVYEYRKKKKKWCIYIHTFEKRKFSKEAQRYTGAE